MELVEVIGIQTNCDRGRNGWNMKARSHLSPGVGPGQRRDNILRSVGTILRSIRRIGWIERMGLQPGTWV